jgi:RNA polymerase sigma-70 factor (ECF subfamily)
MLKILNQDYPDCQTQLVEGCKRGERQAQHRLYQQYATAMYNVCRRMTKHDAEAEDILQEAFVDAFRKIDTFKGESTFGAWLKRIVINKTINHLKKNQRMTWVSVDKMDFEDHEPPQTDRDMQYKVKQVHQAIQQLPDGFRSVLSLYLLEGYDHREIAEILEISESTSKSQYNRAKKKLNQILESYER